MFYHFEQHAPMEDMHYDNGLAPHVIVEAAGLRYAMAYLGDCGAYFDGVASGIDEENAYGDRWRTPTCETPEPALTSHQLSIHDFIDVFRVDTDTQRPFIVVHYMSGRIRTYFMNGTICDEDCDYDPTCKYAPQLQTRVTVNAKTWVGK